MRSNTIYVATKGVSTLHSEAMERGGETHNEVLGVVFWPYYCIDGRLTRVDISLRRTDPPGSLQNLPEEEEAEIDGNTDVIGNEGLVIETSGNAVESVEQDDYREEDEGSICCVWLESGFVDEGIPVDSLCPHSLVESNIGNQDRGPREEGGDGGDILEPLESCVRPTRA